MHWWYVRHYMPWPKHSHLLSKLSTGLARRKYSTTAKTDGNVSTCGANQKRQNYSHSVKAQILQFSLQNFGREIKYLFWCKYWQAVWLNALQSLFPQLHFKCCPLPFIKLNSDLKKKTWYFWYFIYKLVVTIVSYRSELVNKVPHYLWLLQFTETVLLWPLWWKLRGRDFLDIFGFMMQPLFPRRAAAEKPLPAEDRIGSTLLSSDQMQVLCNWTVLSLQLVALQKPAGSCGWSEPSLQLGRAWNTALRDWVVALKSLIR